jgi:hypothetical protein
MEDDRDDEACAKSVDGGLSFCRMNKDLRLLDFSLASRLPLLAPVVASQVPRGCPRRPWINITLRIVNKGATIYKNANLLQAKLIIVVLLAG